MKYLFLLMMSCIFITKNFAQQSETVVLQNKKQLESLFKRKIIIKN